MSISQAEAVNFGNAVQKKAYERKAQQVDTFVQSETAEQKLARSGKMQTAKAIEAVASLGSTYLSSEAQAAEAKTQEMRSQLEDYVTRSLEEVQSGAVDHWTKSQYVGQMPVALHMEMARAVAKRKHLADRSTFQQAIAADPNILLDDDKYNQLTSDTFKYEAPINDALGALTASTYNDLQTSFFQTQDVKKEEARSAETIAKLKDDAGTRIDTDFLSLGMEKEDYTTIVNKKPVLDQAAWEKVASPNADGEWVFDADKWSKVVTQNILRDDAAYLKRSGLRPEQYKPIVQQALLDRAVALKMPELLANVPELYRNEVFNDKIIELTTDIKNFTFTEWSRNQAQLNAARDQAAVDAADLIFNKNNGGMVDQDWADTQGRIVSEEAKAHNKRVENSTSTNQSGINQGLIYNSLDIAITNGTPLLGLDGKPVMWNGEPLDPMNEAHVGAWLKMHPSLQHSHKGYLIEQISNIQSKANIHDNQFLAEGTKQVEALTSNHHSQFWTLDDPQEARNEYKRLFHKHWKLTQAQPDNKGKNIKNNLNTQHQIMQDALTEWKTLEHLFTGKSDGDNNPLKTDDSGKVDNPQVDSTQQPKPETKAKTEVKIPRVDDVNKKPDTWQDAVLQLDDDAFKKLSNKRRKRHPTEGGWNPKDGLSKEEYLEIYADSMEDAYQQQESIRKSNEWIAEKANDLIEWLDDGTPKMSHAEKAYFEKTGDYPLSVQKRMERKLQEETGKVMSKAQEQRYLEGLKLTNDIEAYKQKTRDKGYKLPD